MQDGSLRSQLLRGGAGSAIVRVSGLSLSLILGAVLARTLGPENYGIYSYVIALISLLAIPAKFGLPNLIIRESAKAVANADWATLKGIWRWASGLALALSLMIMASGSLISQLTVDHFSPTQLKTFEWALIFMPVLVLGVLQGAALRGLRHVVTGQLFEAVLRPGFLITIILVSSWFGLTQNLNADTAMGFNVIATTMAFFVGTILFHNAKPNETRSYATTTYHHRAWLTSVLPLGIIGATQFVNSNLDILILGLFRESDRVGIYRVASSGSMLVTFGLHVINMVVAPLFAQFYSNGHIEKMQRIASITARLAVSIALPTALIFIFFGDYLLSIIFGSSYELAYLPLLILSFGHLINAAMGSVGLLLSMAGFERIVLRRTLVAMTVNIAGNLLLIPSFGMYGAAFATALSVITQNLLLFRDVKLRIKITSSIFGNSIPKFSLKQS